MEWSLSKEKEQSIQQLIDFFLRSKTCNLKQIQKLHGKLANFALSMDLMKSFKFNMLQLLNKFQGQDGIKINSGGTEKGLMGLEKMHRGQQARLPNPRFRWRTTSFSNDDHFWRSRRGIGMDRGEKCQQNNRKRQRGSFNFTPWWKSSENSNNVLA